MQNQGRFYDRFEHIVLLSAPLDVPLERLRTRTTNPYGKTAVEQDEVRLHQREVEPLLHQGATTELDGTQSVGVLADAVEELLSHRPEPT